MQAGHAVYQGQVGHLRLTPKEHGFNYALALFWLDSSMLDEASLSIHGIRFERFGALSYRRSDYLSGDNDIYQAVCNKVMQLGASTKPSRVFILTPLANWGIYFSPLTLYYCYNEQGELSYLLAEVSNTPWNERHYYLHVIVKDQQRYQHEKAFHVSPFNPISMQYLWRITAPDNELHCSITNIKDSKQVFSAWINLQRHQLTPAWKRHWLIRQPWQNVQIVLRIYWHALKLLVKGVPVHAHPKTKDKSA